MLRAGGNQNGHGQIERNVLWLILLCAVLPLGTMAVMSARDETIALVPNVRTSIGFVILLVVCFCSLLTMRAIHRRLEPFELIQRKLGWLSTTNEINRLVVSAFDTRGIVTALQQRIRDLYPCDVVGIALMDPDPPHGLRVYVDRGEGEAQRFDFEGFTPEEVHHLYNDLESLIMPIDERSPHYLQPLVEAGAQNALVVPLLVQQDLTGVIALGSRDPDVHDEARKPFVRQVADQAASALFGARLTEENRNLAYYDALTGLPNRALYLDRLERALIFAQRRKGLVATCLMDLDGFNRINETLGHGGGDRILREVAYRLQSRLRLTDAVARSNTETERDAEDLISRHGGDDFTFLLTEISQAQDAGLVARRMLDAISEPFQVDGKEVYVSASIGIAVYPTDGDDVRSLLLNAGTALSCAKARGRDHFQFFTKSMNMEASRKIHLESRLQGAIERGETFLHYQPITDARTGRMVAAEALVRWDDPEMGMVAPDEFIPVAEETHAMVPLGLWVLRRACEQLKAWREAGFEPFRLAVNLSVRQLRDPGLAAAVTKVLQETGVSAAQLEFEITESVAVRDDDATLGNLEALRDLGTTLALDDFGTGYSSLSYLRRLQVDRVKIDRSFVKDLPGNEEDASLTAAIIAMASSLSVQVIAEGVETLEQAEFLRERGCGGIQGYLISRPVSAEEFTRFLEREKRGEDAE